MKQEEMDNRMVNIENLLIKMSQQIEGLSQRIDKLEQRIDRLEQKVDAIEKKLEEHDQRFAAIEKKLKEHDQKFAAIAKKLKEHDQKFVAIEKKLKEHDQRFAEIIETQEILQANIGMLNTQVGEVKKELKILSGRVAVIEVEQGEKIQALFNVITNPSQKVYSVREEIDLHEDRLDEHDVRIRVLESKSK